LRYIGSFEVHVSRYIRPHQKVGRREDGSSFRIEKSVSIRGFFRSCLRCAPMEKEINCAKIVWQDTDWWVAKDCQLAVGWWPLVTMPQVYTEDIDQPGIMKA